MDMKVENWKARNSVWRNSKKYKELSGRTREENRLIKQEEKKRKKLAESNEADAKERKPAKSMTTEQ